ncbi:flagellar hook-associated family protein [Yersinia ruckeri]|uniref:flagellar filament capping protein FliD n=1 Tax=Yersinia ruckeri TaxID=29486 RepID=UPI0005ABC37B|nr:flagellar filament capping protein FliD [Yersinia ruckeri]AJI96018.1 flagellar hook-associated family protein [Yersinia ruckeri]MCW6569112.1 flagellar filament capping protein FliD [Yersinia ruckeri]
MASISSLGAGSGLQLSELLDNLSSAEQKKLVPLTQQQTSYKGKLTAFGVLQSALAKVETAAAALKKANTINGTSVSSSNTAFSATTDSAASAGSYSITVEQLAQSQSLLSAKMPNATDKLGNDNESRTLTITQPGQKKPMEVVLTKDQTSLTDIRDAINKKEGNVTASIMKGDDNSYYLSLTSKTTGTESEMTVSVTGDDDLSKVLSYTPEPAGGSGSGSGAMTQTVKAADAKLTVNGISITRQSNVITDAPEGVTLTLKSKTKAGEPETLNVVHDSKPTKDAIQAFVDAYNSLQTTFTSLTKYTAVEAGADQSTSNGALVGDGTLRNIQTQLKSQLASSQAGDIKTLASLGITQEISGKLKVDSDKLDKALKDKPNAVTQFFAGDGENTGFATQMDKLLNDALDTSKGTLKNATDGINKSLKNLDKQVVSTTANINATIERYKIQFAQLDKLVTSFNSTASMLTAQFK